MSLTEQQRAGIVERLESSRVHILAQFAGAEAVADKSYAPGKWTAREIMTHVADTELVYGWRFMRAVGDPGEPVHAFEQDRWVRNAEYSRRPLTVSALLFEGARALMIHNVRALPLAVLGQCCLHPERGPVEAWRWAESAINHGIHHASQVQTIRLGQPWRKD